MKNTMEKTLSLLDSGYTHLKSSH